MPPSPPRDLQHSLHRFHEQQMAAGQEHYFAASAHGLQVRPEQRLWLFAHSRWITRLLNLAPQEVFLDLGCGEGFYTRPLSRLAHHSFGLDFSSGALKVLQQQPDYDPARLDLALASAHELPLPSACVDKILCNHVLEHVLDDGAVLAEIWRLLRPLGRVVIGVPIAYSPQIHFFIRLRRLLRPNARTLQLEKALPGQLVPELVGKEHHIRFYSAASLQALLARQGFLPLKSVGIGFSLNQPVRDLVRHSPLLFSLSTALSTRLPAIGDGLLILAEKKS